MNDGPTICQLKSSSSKVMLPCFAFQQECRRVLSDENELEMFPFHSLVVLALIIMANGCITKMNLMNTVRMNRE